MGCQSHLLLAFLRDVDADAIYLVGDIVDGWQLKRNWYWPQEHNDVVQKLLRKARKGSRLIYIPGNHDEFLRDYLGCISARSRSFAIRSTKPPTDTATLSCMAMSSMSSCVICGHIHYAVIGKRQDIIYINCGDWVESCTAVAETYGGEFVLLHWPELRLKTVPDPGPVGATA